MNPHSKSRKPRGCRLVMFVHQLLCQDTVEQRIHPLQADQGRLAAGILAHADQAATLDPATVRELLDP